MKKAMFKTQKSLFKFVQDRDMNKYGFWECAHCHRSLGAITRSLRAHNFSHIKPKGRYPELKYDSDNIEIICYVCHCKEHHINIANPAICKYLDD